MTRPTNPSFDTRILEIATYALWRITRALLSKTEALHERLDLSVRTDLDDEADELRAIISDCSKDKAQAEDRLTEVLGYLDPDDFYGGFTPRPQVPEGAGLVPAADLTPVDEDDAPQGYRAVEFMQPEDRGCRRCAFYDAPEGCPRKAEEGCPRKAEEVAPFWCHPESRPDGRSVRFIKRD